jgi:hypothetical protein
MVEVKEAVKIASDFFAEIFGGQYKNLALEEIDSEGHYWYVTLGFDDPAGGIGNVFKDGKWPRNYKRIRVNKNDGSVDSVTIRKI